MLLRAATALFCFSTVVSLSSFLARRARIGVDYGPRLIGIACSDVYSRITPHSTIRNNGNLTQISEQISDLAKSIRASEIVLGVPLDSNGRLDYQVKNINAKICLNFSYVLTSVVKRLCPFDVKVWLTDERATTQEARTLYGRRNVDAIAAACILDGYIEDRGEGSIEAIPCEFPPPSSIATFDYEIIRRFVELKYGMKDVEDARMLRDHVKNYKVYKPHEE